MKQVWGIVLGLFMLAGGVEARTPSPGSEPPPEVIDAVQALVVDGWLPYDASDPENSGPPAPKADAAQVRRWRKTGLLKRVNLTPGKAPDWLIDTEKTEYPAAWCGTGGCLVEIWSPGADGHYVKVFRNQIREYHVRPIPGRGYGWLETDFHGSVCGRTGVEACPWGFEWRDDGLGKLALRSSLRFVRTDMLDAGSPPQALDPATEGDAEVIPVALDALMGKQISTCADMKATLAEGSLAVRMPDLNGDGIDDWSYDGIYLSCEFADGAPPELADFDFCTKLDCGWQVWVSQRTGNGVDWRPVPLDKAKFYALSLRPGQAPGIVELTNRPGVDDDDYLHACASFMIQQCVQTPISLSPKP